MLTIEECRPSTSTVELGLAHVEGRVASSACIETVVKMLIEFALAWRFSPFLTNDSELEDVTSCIISLRESNVESDSGKLPVED